MPDLLAREMMTTEAIAVYASSMEASQDSKATLHMHWKRFF